MPRLRITNIMTSSFGGAKTNISVTSKQNVKIIPSTDIVLKKPEEYTSVTEIIEDIKSQHLSVRFDYTSIANDQAKRLMRQHWAETGGYDALCDEIDEALDAASRALIFYVNDDNKTYEVKIDLKYATAYNMLDGRYDTYDEIIEPNIRAHVDLANIEYNVDTSSFTKCNLLKDHESMSVNEFFEMLKTHANASEYKALDTSIYGSTCINLDCGEKLQESVSVSAGSSDCTSEQNISSVAIELTLRDCMDRSTLTSALTDCGIPFDLWWLDDQDIVVTDVETGDEWTIDEVAHALYLNSAKSKIAKPSNGILDLRQAISLSISHFAADAQASFKDAEGYKTLFNADDTSPKVYL